MPGMDGLALSREFLKICPDTVIVIMTAWQEFEYVKEAMQIGVKHFLAHRGCGLHRPDGRKTGRGTEQDFHPYGSAAEL